MITRLTSELQKTTTKTHFVHIKNTQILRIKLTVLDGDMSN